MDEALRAFGSERALLLAVHQRWQTNLLARLDQVLEQGADDPHLGVHQAVVELSRDLPGFAALLDEHADDPTLSRARQALARHVDQACGCGRPHPLVASPPARSMARKPARRPCVMAVRCRRRLARLLAAAHRSPGHAARRNGPDEPRLVTRPALGGA